MQGKICCNGPMSYTSIEFTGLEGETVRIWRLICGYCGATTEQQYEVVEGRGPLGWMERHIEDRRVSEELRENAPYYEANFPD